MTLGIIPESDRKGRAVCQSYLQGGKHNVTPTDKNSVRQESPWGPPDPPPLFLGKEGDYKVPRKNSLNKYIKRDSNLPRRRRS